MAPTIPPSLSPHICILSSPDLNELLENSSLPSLPHILQSFSPLPQVTTRTTSLAPVPHSSFALRFSDLQDVEEACREDEDQRAIRTIDWMTARLSKRCTKWVQDVDAAGEKEGLRTPWWDELRRCAEGDFVPDKTEGWNHPVALVFAVSTTAPNPLQAITALHSRAIQFPSWVDPNFLRYTLIIHPQNSPLSTEEAGALFNAVKKQFGLHSYLLSLALPKLPPPPIPVPALMPRLPPPPSSESPQPTTPTTPNIPGNPGSTAILNTLRMEEKDIQQTARFTREFVVMSLVPWMEKCVLEWNESFSSTRRLPSRLFSSTRRLFGSSSPSPAPNQIPALSSVPPLPGRSATLPLNGISIPPPQQRRLAEFGTILGDFKLAVTVWEALRKESKGGSDILPMLLSPSPTVPLHAQSALTTIHPNMADLPPLAQVRALRYAVRWEAGIATQDFLSGTLEGERWLVWAASNAEEAPSALLLAQAALLSVKKKARRRAALWYVSAATRLEKCGIKPLTMYFLRKAQDLCEHRPPKELSPSFWDSEGKFPNTKEGLEDILSGIEHPLGRLLYTTGDVSGAVRLFLSLLKGASAVSSTVGHFYLGEAPLRTPSNDKLYLDDFRVAFNYWKSTEPDQIPATNLRTPFKLCVGKQPSLRFPGDNFDPDDDVWLSRQDAWTSFWKSRGGSEKVAAGGKVSICELFWIDLIMQNPLDAEINLSNVTLVVNEDLSNPASAGDFIEVEVIKEVIIGPHSSTSVPISLKSNRPAKLSITHAKYDFLSVLPTLESLASRGRRLHETALQRQQPTYAPDSLIQVEVVPSEHRMLVTYIDCEPLILLQGENKAIRFCLTNSGSKPINEVWMVSDPDDEIWIGVDDDFENSSITLETIRSRNSLHPQEPQRIPLHGSPQSSILQPGDSMEVTTIFHAESTGTHKLCLLFVFRENNSPLFHSTKLACPYEVRSLFETSVSAQPSRLRDYSYLLDVHITNVSPIALVEVTHITSVSPQWTSSSLSEDFLGIVAPSQCARFLLGASSWMEGLGSNETRAFVSTKLSSLLKGESIDLTSPPFIDLVCSHISKTPRRSMQDAAIVNLVQSGRRNFTSRQISQGHPYIASNLHPFIFPLYNPYAIDFIVFWKIPSRNISGHCGILGITLGAGDAALENIIEEAESAKLKRSMYAETRRENMEVLDAIRMSEWNTEMNPIVVSMREMGTTLHNFANGPCQISLEFCLRNHSLTHPAQYTLKLLSKTNPASNLLPPPYIGRLTFRGTIPPSELTIVSPKLCITRPGSYGSRNWLLETEVTIPSRERSEAKWKRRYVEEPKAVEEEAPCITVCDIQIA